MRLYISGPMSGVPAFNIPAFDALAAKLRSLGHDVVSPAELDDPAFRRLCVDCESGSLDELAKRCKLWGIERATWGDLLARDVKLLADDGIEGIVCLSGWQLSRGACLETFVGRLCNIPLYTLSDSGMLLTVSEEERSTAHGDNWVSAGEKQRIQHRQVKQAKHGFTAPEGGNFLQTGSHFDTETRIVDPETGGEKGSKQCAISDLDPRAMWELGEVAGYGAIKYPPRMNFAKGYAWSLSYAAAQRHLMQFWNREEIDQEMGKHHLAAAAWHCLTLLSFVFRDLGTDDRMVE